MSVFCVQQSEVMLEALCKSITPFVDTTAAALLYICSVIVIMYIYKYYTHDAAYYYDFLFSLYFIAGVLYLFLWVVWMNGVDERRRNDWRWGCVYVVRLYTVRIGVAGYNIDVKCW